MRIEWKTFENCALSENSYLGFKKSSGGFGKNRVNSCRYPPRIAEANSRVTRYLMYDVIFNVYKKLIIGIDYLI